MFLDLPEAITFGGSDAEAKAREVLEVTVAEGYRYTDAHVRLLFVLAP